MMTSRLGVVGRRGCWPCWPGTLSALGNSFDAPIKRIKPSQAMDLTWPPLPGMVTGRSMENAKEGSTELGYMNIPTAC